jgi:hypothetical protein
MSAFIAKHYWALVMVCMSATALLAADPRDAQRFKAEVERKSAENKRKIEQRSREIKAAVERNSQQVLKDMAAARSGSLQSSAPTFDAANAPPPDEVFRAFVETAKNATSMEQILPYLPKHKQEGLKAKQAMFDPKQAAKNRDSLKKQNPKLSEDDLAHLSNSPYAFMLKWHKGMANSIVRIVGVKIDGDKATLAVSTNSGATINGEYYGYGEADVEMVGEGPTWKLAGFKSSIVYHKNGP